MIRSVLLVGFMTMAMSPSLATAQVSIEFVQPQRFTHLGNYRADYKRNMEHLEGFFVAAISECLAEGAKLQIVVHNVDLAGYFEPGIRSPGVRLMREIDVPRIDLEYTWHAADGAVVAEKRETLSDINYLGRGTTHRGTGSQGSQPLRYDKHMIERWAEKTFCMNSD